MAIEPLRLDDLDWQGMVDAIRRRIPAASGGNWTFHAPVDPGVTLLELFAALLEQRVYRLDTTPGSLLRAALRLLGETPRPTAAAATVLELAPAPFDVVADQTELRLAGRTPRLVLTTGGALTRLPLVRLEIEIGGRDRTQDLLHGRLLRLFPADGTSAEARIVLRLGAKIPLAPPAAPFGLLFELDAPARLRPSWDPEAIAAVAVKPPAQISWEYPSEGSGRLTPFPARPVDDGTGGLRRSGLVRLPIPADWHAEETSEAGRTLFGYAVHLRVERTTFSAPPRLAGLTANAVDAHHRRHTRVHSLTIDRLPLPGFEIALADLPAGEAEKDHPPLEETVVLHLRERDQGCKPWQPTPDLAFHGPDERVFEVDRRLGVLRFGDGLTGRQPVLAPAAGGPNVQVRYDVGGGPEGNLGRGLSWLGAGDLAAKNVVPAAGGTEAQPLTEARDETAASLKRPTRAVLRRDFEELARSTPGVAIARARAALGLHPEHRCPVPGAVTVFVVPEVPREEASAANDELRESAFVAAPVPDPGELDAVRARLDAARLVTTEVFVAPPRYRPVSILVEVEADPLDPAELENRLTASLRSFLDPLTGGDDRAGWPFGEPVRPSALLREAQASLGGDGEVSRVVIGLDGNAPSQDCQDVAIGEHELVFLDDLRLALRRNAPGRGGLR